MLKLTVHLVTWNGAKYVPYLFESLKKQSFKDWKLLIWDNASSDGMVEAMKKELLDFPVPYEVIENTENIGFAGGHNVLFQKTDAEYFVCLNQDMYLESDTLLKLVQFLDAHSDVAVVSPRLMKWNFSLLLDEKNAHDAVYSDEVDSLGLKVFRSRRVIEQYGQEKWQDLKKIFPSHFLEVFGVSGAFPLFRRSSISQITFKDNSFFDASYHSYKEDVDLAYRLRSAGFKAFVHLDAVVYHDRSAAGPKEESDVAALQNKKTQSSWVKYHSYKNHLMTLYKNEYWQNFILDFPYIVWYEFKKFVYFLLRERKILGGLQEIYTMRRELKQKKNLISSKRKISAKEIRIWWI